MTVKTHERNGRTQVIGILSAVLGVTIITGLAYFTSAFEEHRALFAHPGVGQAVRDMEDDIKDIKTDMRVVTSQLNEVLRRLPSGDASH